MPSTNRPFTALRLAWFRYLLDYPGQLILAVAGIALGIAVVVAIDLAKESALAAFVQATETVSGKAGYRIVGYSGSVDENLYPKLKLGKLPFHYSPKIEGYVNLDGRTSEKLRLLGVDPFAERNFGSIETLDLGAISESGRRDLISILTRPGYVIVSKTTAERLRLGGGDNIKVVSGGHKKILKIAAVLEFSEPLQRQAMEDLILTDIAGAQEILELFGNISYIDVTADGRDVDPSAVKALKQQLPDAAELIPYQRISQNARDLTASFYTNLTALSLLSVTVGLFLIYNTIHFLAIRRRTLIGMLRALGTSRRQIFQLVISESAMLGCSGTMAGLLLGTFLAYGMLDLIGETINNVYLALPAQQLQLSLMTFIKGLCLGTAASVMSAVLPAIEAIRIEPFHAMARSELESNTRRQALKSALSGLVALVAGGVTTFLSGKSLAYGFAGLMFLVLGCALLTPFLLLALSRIVYPMANRIFGITGSLPVRSLKANLSRSGLAVAALMVAISATLGVQIMVFSFRSSVGDWLHQRLSADLYISAASGSALRDSPLNEHYLVKISQLDEILSVGSVRRRTLQNRNGLDQLSVYTFTPDVPKIFDLISANTDQVWTDFVTNDTVLVTESYAYNHELGKGSMVELATDHGMKQFRVGGVYKDYSPGTGGITMSRITYRRYWNDHGYSAISVYAKPGTDLKDLQRKLHNLSDTEQALEITERSSILNASISIFDQAFAVTDSLQWIAATIAFLGVFSVLTAIQLDRVREYGILRAIGITSKQLAILITAESGLMGLVAGLLAIPVGLMIAMVLVYVINQRSFGWSIAFHIPPESILQGLSSGMLAAILAGLIPAYRMSRLLSGNALRNE